ncbi:hypothetical protein H1P_1870016 [Hyella patelloides LEGE 07179]|uniref:Uncharacterized protein n=1 Tax=Hyella patelloides LEGE 07179 TaxID=945734 RepID=A0A563VNX3_9CYAN|nr:hypothetical protein H1P_1870016 [Hyella patelloides LEGE 07179]
MERESVILHPLHPKLSDDLIFFPLHFNTWRVTEEGYGGFISI